MLESAQRANGQQGVQKLRQQTEEALKRQEEISRSVDELARSGQAGNEQKKEQIGERKQALADQVAGLERDIDQAARGMGQDRQQASDKLRDAANSIRQNRIPDKIRQNQELISRGYMDQARERERTIKNNLEEVLKDLQAAEGGASKNAQGQGLEDALNKARELADNLESLKRKMESGDQQGQDQNGQQGQQAGQQNQQGQQGQQSGQNQQGQRGQQGQQAGAQNQSGRAGQQRQQGGQQGRQQGQQGQRGQQQGQQAQQQGQRGQQQGQQGQQGQGQQQGQQGQQGQGQQQGQQGQQGQGQQQGQQGQGRQGQGQQGQQGQQGGQQGSQQGGNPSNGSAADPSFIGGGRPNGQRQLESELRQRLADAEDLKRALGKNTDLAKDLNRAVEQLRKFNPNAFSDPNQLSLLKNEVIDPLRALEVELARRLQAKLGNNGAGAFGDGDAPDRYRKTIEDYYRRLSARQPEQKP